MEEVSVLPGSERAENGRLIIFHTHNLMFNLRKTYQRVCELSVLWDTILFLYTYSQ
jgi:hypothetical protein